MKNYITAEERRIVFLLLVLQSTINDFLKKSRMSKEEHKYLKTSTTYLQKWLTSLFERVGVQEGIRLKKESESQEIIMRTKGPATSKVFVTLSEEEFLTLADGILFSYCKDCKYTGDKVKKCAMRKLMVEKGIPSFSNGECEYKDNMQ